MADLDVSIITLCLPLWATAITMTGNLVPDKDVANEFYLAALLFFASAFLSLYVDYLLQRYNLQGIHGENLLHRVLVNPFTCVVPNGGNLFIFLNAVFIPFSLIDPSIKMFWIGVYLTFTGLLYIYGFLESNNLLKWII